MNNKKYVVLIAAIVYNLSIGVLYSWSIVKSSLVNDLHWSNTFATLPYTIAIVAFAVSLLIGGIIQDKYGPRKVVICGGALVGLGMIVSSFVIDNPKVVAITFGIISGHGIGLGYSAVTPACLKWFPPSKKGLISGIVVGACGLSALIFSPLTQYILDNYGVSEVFLYIGIGILIVSVLSALFITNPPTTSKQNNSANSKNLKWNEMVKTREFYLIFAIYAFGASVGLMIIGNMKDIFINQVGDSTAISAAMLVALLSIFNAFGRIFAGVISDKIGRIQTLTITAILQIVAMIFFPTINSEAKIVLGSLLIGYTYGSYLSVIPAYCADKYGMKWYGRNYGIIYLAWGLAGVIAPMSAATIGIEKAYTLSAVISIVVFALCFVLLRFENKTV